MLALPGLLLAQTLALLYIAPFAQAGSTARIQRGDIVRIVPLLFASCLAGCSAAPFFSANKGGISADSVRSYAKSHGLSRDEARRELEMYRDADYLKELRQQQAAADSSAAADDDPAAGNQPTAR